MKTRHLSTNPGKRVRLVMRDGSLIEGRFLKREDAFVYLDAGVYRCAKIRAMIVNPRPPMNAK